ncbi:MAG: hypothetical protein CMF79_02225 [Candidatus Marinimicrobia bacterium]|nr:hypothetical protein [Candidatus Neomarinimicrobiota bacterium]
MLKIKYQIDNIPLWFKPFYYISTYLGLWLIVFYRWIIQKTCTIIIEGQEFIDLYPSRIEAIWHYRGSMYWLGLQNVTNHVQFSHPLWFMYKIILALRWHGCKVVIGSTGYGGREAADKIVAEIKNGYCCCITPDGPAGPFKEVKKGVLHMCMQSGVPVIPVQCDSSLSFPIFWNWDKKRVPFFFSTITIRYQEPMFVTEENFDDVHKQLAIAMGD